MEEKNFQREDQKKRVTRPLMESPVEVDFNIEELSFKPMTKGLGFHQDSKKAIRYSSLEGGNIQTHHKIGTKSPGVGKRANPIGDDFLKSSEIKSPPRRNLDARRRKTETKNSVIFSYEKLQFISLQMLAWLVDSICIFLMYSFTFLLFLLATGLNIYSFSEVMNVESILFSVLLFSMFYLVYFTFLDLVSTPGKVLLGLKLINLENGRVVATQTFLRALVTLCSAPLMFVPLLFDLQSNLSETRIVKEQN